MSEKVKEALDKAKDSLKRGPKKAPSKKAPSKKAPSKKTSSKKRGENSGRGGPRSLKDIYREMKEKYPGKPQVDPVPTGSLIMDSSILLKGLPRGRIVEMFGQTGTGKSTICLDACASACREGMRAVYIDAEFAMNDGLLDGVGVSEFAEDRFFLHKSRTFADIDDLLMGYLDADDPPELVVIDSAKAVIPSKLAHGSVEADNPGLPARLWSQFMVKYKSWVGAANTCLVIINQVRNTFKRGPKNTWIVKEESAANNALKFFTDIRLKLSVANKGEIYTVPDDPDTHIGNNVLVKTLKNKVSPMKHGIVAVLFGEGISNVRALMVYLEEAAGIVETPAQKGGGAFYTVKWKGEEVNLRGKTAYAEWIAENHEEVIAHLREEDLL